MAMKKFDSEQVLKDIISNLGENKGKLYKELIETDEGHLAILKATRKYEAVGKAMKNLREAFVTIDTLEFTVEIGKHRKTHNIFVVFKRDDVDKVFDLWMNNKPPQKV